MSSIMMDRWSIESIYLHMLEAYPKGEDFLHIGYVQGLNGGSFISRCWDNFLIAILLWDEIWSFRLHERYKHDKYPLSPLWEDTEDHPEGVLLDKIDKIIHNIEQSDIDESYKNIYETLSIEGIDLYDNIFRRAKLYQLMSNSLGIPYFAHPSRRLFTDYFTRLDLFEKVDRELMDYYNKINKELGRNILNFNYPVLLDFIKKDTQTIEDEFDRAMELRMNDDVVIFRKQLFDIEQSIMRGDTQLLLSELKMVSDLAKEITNKYQKRTNLGEFTIALSPSLTIPLSLGKNKKRALHATFIRRLIDFGVYERG